MIQTLISIFSPSSSRKEADSTHLCAGPSKMARPNQLSEAFMNKFRDTTALRRYFAGDPERDQKTKVFTDPAQFVSTEGLAILLKSEMYTSFLNGNNISNTKLVEDDPRSFATLDNYLHQFTKFKNGDDIKLLVKTRECEPSEDIGEDGLPVISKSWGVHPVPVYIRNVNGRGKVFIYDCAAGLIFDKREGYDLMIPTIEAFLQKHFGDNYDIIKTSTITQRDSTNCIIYGLDAMTYFMEHGHELFDKLEEHHFVEKKSKIVDRDNDHIKHLKIDRLPPELLKLTNRNSLKSIQAAYDHEWMPIHPQLSSEYYDNKNVLAHVNGVMVNGKTIKKIIQEHSKLEKVSEVHTQLRNFLPFKLMNEARNKIGGALLDQGVIKTHGSSADLKALETYMQGLPLRR